MKGKTHWADIRLYVNAGMRYSTCLANRKWLNTESRAVVTTDKAAVTCLHCRREITQYQKSMGLEPVVWEE
jgi:hypothetical protein